MMNRQTTTTQVRSESILATNRVLRNTYFLLSLTLLFSALIAGITVHLNLPAPGIIISLVGMFGLLFLTQATARSGLGLISVFLFTGFMGYMLGPMINLYLHAYVNGGQLVMTALGATGVIFLGLSGYAITTRKDFSYLGGFIFVAILVAFMAGIGAMLFNIPTLSLFVSGAFALLSSAIILYQTSLIINGGETNYILATVTLYVALFNLFVSLLNILGAFAGNKN